MFYILHVNLPYDSHNRASLHPVPSSLNRDRAVPRRHIFKDRNRKYQR